LGKPDWASGNNISSRHFSRVVRWQEFSEIMETRSTRISKIEIIHRTSRGRTCESFRAYRPIPSFSIVILVRFSGDWPGQGDFMKLEKLQDQWNALGKNDPLEAILSRDGMNGGPWDIEEFFATGVREIDAAMADIKDLGIAVSGRRALDFGCGIGRLTQALGRYFQEVDGVDIAPSMIALANRYNRLGEKCHYLLNESDDLKLFPDGSFDLIYSVITLQHMQPLYSKKYIREFLRILAPGGVLIFQIPSEPILFHENGTLNLSGLILRILPKKLLDATYRKIRYGRKPRAENNLIRKQEMMDFLAGIGARIISVQQSRSSIFIDCRYFVTKD
jgi:SAM-dependent methyltransferase